MAVGAALMTAGAQRLPLLDTASSLPLANRGLLSESRGAVGDIMYRRSEPLLTTVAWTIALWCGPSTVSAQTTMDVENRYPHVGVIMVWRVDDTGKPVELRG